MALVTTTMTMSTMDLSQRKPLDQEIDVFGATDIGKIRSENQDQFLICALQKEIQLWGTSLSRRNEWSVSGSGNR